MELREIVGKFTIDGEFIGAQPYGDGHINDTYVVATTAERYILQRVNRVVFKAPEEIIRNIENVTAHLRKKIVIRGGDPRRETLTLMPTVEGASFHRADDGEIWRMYLFISGARTYSVVKKAAHFESAARAFGMFQRQLADFPASQLKEAIPDFHNTPKRFERLLRAVEADAMGRAREVRPEIDFALARQGIVAAVTDGIAAGEIPLRVTHNDTKFNNIMIDDKTGEGICVIDLDTVMPGSLLYDYGDSLRSGTNPAAEDERDLSKAYMSNALFEAFTRGFVETVGESLTARERELLGFSGILLTYECGIRFLTDYLEGDAYFKIHRPGQNLDRARAQFKLVADMEAKLAYMNGFVTALTR